MMHVHMYVTIGEMPPNEMMNDDPECLV
jgi:hypothetical protein